MTLPISSAPTEHLPLIPYRATPAPPRPAPAPISMAIRRPSALGFLLIVVFLGGFAAWAFLVPIASGAVASGVVSPDGNRRVIQHYEGGIIAEILVRDGDQVAEGQPLVTLEGKEAEANHRALMAEYLTALAVSTRLAAETSGAETISFPAALATNTPEIAEIVAGQRAIFTRQREYLTAQKEILHKRDEQLLAQLSGIEAQKTSMAEQIALNAEDLATKNKLFESGLVSMPQIIDLRRQESALMGEAGRLSGALSEVADKRAEIAMQLLSLDAERADQLAQESDEARAALTRASEALSVSADVWGRRVLTAPVSGKVVGSRFMSAGGVIRPAEPIMEIVPDQERLMIDARLSVLDIEAVHIGMEAVVRLTALASYGLPKIGGRVTSVSGDRLTDANTGQSYFLVRVEVLPESLALLGEGKLLAGMPAEVLIVTQTRTMAAYLLEPLLKTFERSFRED